MTITVSSSLHASLSGFSFDGLWFFSSADLLSAPAQSSLKLRLASLLALHDTSQLSALKSVQCLALHVLL